MKVVATAMGVGELNGGWRCTAQLWRSDETGWQQDGLPEPGAQCGEVGETWVWHKEFRWVTPGDHEIHIQVYNRKGLLIGKEVFIPVHVVGGEQ
jgi:hypothetical protein